MLTEKGTLPIGVEHNGKIHRDYELREQQVRDLVDIFDDPALTERATKNVRFLELCILANMIIRLGDIPKEEITADLLVGMYQDDMNEIRKAEERLDIKRKSFRDDDKKPS